MFKALAMYTLALVLGDLRAGVLPPSDRKEPRLYLISMPASWRRSCVRPVRRLLLQSEHALSCIAAASES